MKYIFYDNTRVVYAVDSAYVLSYTDTQVVVVPEEGGTPDTIIFGSKCKLLRDDDADVAGMLKWKGVDTTVLDDILLKEYMDLVPEPPKAPAPEPVQEA